VLLHASNLFVDPAPHCPGIEFGSSGSSCTLQVPGEKRFTAALTKSTDGGKTWAVQLRVFASFAGGSLPEP
jgi:hypothetical protein